MTTHYSTPADFEPRPSLTAEQYARRKRQWQALFEYYSNNYPMLTCGTLLAIAERRWTRWAQEDCLPYRFVNPLPDVPTDAPGWLHERLRETLGGGV